MNYIEELLVKSINLNDISKIYYLKEYIENNIEFANIDSIKLYKQIKIIIYANRGDEKLFDEIKDSFFRYNKLCFKSGIIEENIYLIIRKHNNVFCLNKIIKYMVDNEIIDNYLDTQLIIKIIFSKNILENLLHTNIISNDLYSELKEFLIKVLITNKPIDRCINKKITKVFLTYADGPSKYTKGILDLLKIYNNKATFFVIGKNIKDQEHIIKRINNEGHLLGNHTWNHPSLIGISKKEFIKEINTSQKTIYEIVKYYPYIFRPPYGHANKNTIEWSKELGLKICLWNKKNIVDFTKPCMNNIMKDIKENCIILFQDGGGDKTESVKTTKILLEFFKENRIVSNIIDKNNFINIK